MARVRALGGEPFGGGEVVPYRGTGPQLTDLLAGRLDAASVGAPAVMQFIKAGELRCIATGSTTRG